MKKEYMCVKCGKFLESTEVEGYLSYPCCKHCFKKNFDSKIEKYHEERFVRGHF